MNSSRWPEKIIEYTFYALFFIVPIIWLPVTSELFEFNKMIAVYFGTSVILTAWLYKSVSEGSLLIKRTPIDIPILLFLAANILSTAFSIDRQTSIFGYYSRWNGGLLSTFSYIILFYALVTFLDREKLFRLLKVLLASSAIVALYAILQHPTPFFRNPDGSFRGVDAGYWQQNSEKRSFSTLGHANWLAAYLAMVTPFAFFFLFLAKKVWEKTTYAVALIAYFIAFTFAYSRGGTVGFVATILTLIVGSAYVFRKNIFTFIKSKSYISPGFKLIKPPSHSFFLLLVAVSWVLTVYFFGNAFISQGVNIAAIGTEDETQLTRAGPETGKIRLIVWRGSWEIFKHYPILGSGLETFTFSYYEFKPEIHNYTTEWNFLYNKAHNEFVNYLATTGTVGFFSYLLFISAFIIWLIIEVRRKNNNLQKYLIVVALASYIGYHTQNLFGFSVVPIALLFYLIPGVIFVFLDAVTQAKISLPARKNMLVTNLLKIGVLCFGIVLVVGTTASWLADFYYNLGISTSNEAKSYRNLKTAVALRPDEPLYKAGLGKTIIVAAAKEKNTKDKQNKLAEGINYLNQATGISPNNIVLWSSRLSAIYELATYDERYIPQAIDTAEIIAELAPTDAQVQYNLGSIYSWAGDLKKAQKQLEKVVSLRYIYKEAWELLLEVDSRLKDIKSLREHFKEYADHFPKDAKSSKFLTEIGQ